MKDPLVEGFSDTQWWFSFLGVIAFFGMLLPVLLAMPLLIFRWRAWQQIVACWAVVTLAADWAGSTVFLTGLDADMIDFLLPRMAPSIMLLCVLAFARPLARCFPAGEDRSR
jgi:hypothetical protein